MTTDDAYKKWLEEGGAKSVGGRNSRTSAIRTIERKLDELGMPFPDLDAAWKADRFESLRGRLRQMREDARVGGQDYRILMPNAEEPLNRLATWSGYVGQYGRFLDGEPPGPTRPIESGVSPDDNMEQESQMLLAPVNLILYGPPGTGKTFSTAAEAVSLCGEQVPEDRDTLMQTYRHLVAMGRIEFVTFHQSMSYEDFVEGRQPMTESDAEDETPSAGFRLETVPGIFRRIAKRAQTRAC